jgi:uncharacterized membrane protein YgcG
MKYLRTCALAATALVAAACAHHLAPENDPVVLARVRADLRIVGGETTWVAHGVGYELVARTKGDIAVLQPALERTSDMFTRAFPHDTLARVVATVRRVSAEPGKGAAPVPAGSTGPVVELLLPDAKLRDEERKRPWLFSGRAMESEIVRPVLRSWLAAHASKVTGKPARFAELAGEVDDEDVPAWTYDMMLLTGDSATVDSMTSALDRYPETVIPLENFFTMARPWTPERIAEGRNSGEPSRSPGDEGSGRSRGGMGRGGGGYGRGGSRGRSSPREEIRPSQALEGAALFAAQSAVLGRFLSREGFGVIGELADAQISRKPLEPVLNARGWRDLATLDREWRHWLDERGAALYRK